ncbi:hypothetical protein K491DRAFT_674071 [Lophiostoma macrostomum CBS 122681]|uniref:Uncharacterized protein n=1 Tax=Lophiostoma macrostomum CBS 122681 TaxID=1314788 RepID=A0A6A6TNS5_9PLEO|nr:hypothetical protein K491DRAFT_674071 [Lophiostoma macrostomum CBS 122681]
MQAVVGDVELVRKRGATPSSRGRRRGERANQACGPGVDSDIDKTNLLDTSGQTRQQRARADGPQQRRSGWQKSTLGGGCGGSWHAEGEVQRQRRLQARGFAASSERPVRRAKTATGRAGAASRRRRAREAVESARGRRAKLGGVVCGMKRAGVRGEERQNPNEGSLARISAAFLRPLGQRARARGNAQDQSSALHASQLYMPSNPLRCAGRDFIASSGRKLRQPGSSAVRASTPPTALEPTRPWPHILLPSACDCGPRTPQYKTLSYPMHTGRLLRAMARTALTMAVGNLVAAEGMPPP